MSFESTIKSVLAGDGTLTGILTGGVYSYAADTRRLGLTRDMSPGPFLDGFLRPCALVKGRSQIGTGAIIDEDQQVASVRQVIEIWLYDDGDAGYTALETARAQIYKLLQLKMLSGGGEVSWVGDIDNLRDLKLDHAVALRADYVVNGTRQSS